MIITAAIAVCAWMIKIATGYPGAPNGITSFKLAVMVVVATAFVRFLMYLFRLWRTGEDHPIAQIRASFVPAMRNFAPILVGIALLSMFLLSISLSKSMIPAVVPFWADAAFAATDRVLFIDPQAMAVALSPALGALGLFYGVWHVAHLGGILWVLHWRGEAKSRHILSFMLTWSIGMILAYIFSSAGPIFTGRYDPAVAPESVRTAANYLWSNYRGEAGVIGGGISAFPSMHVAIAAWLAIVLRSRGWPKLGLVYLLGIFACSIILGWHYAIDGVAGAAIAVLAHRLAGTWLSRGERAMPLVPQNAGTAA